MRKLLTWVKLKLVKVTAALRRVPRAPDLTFSNCSEITRGRDKDRRDGNSLKERGSFSRWANSSGVDNHRRDIRYGKDGQRDLMRMIASFTATSSEDWAVVFDVCEQTSATEENAKKASVALSKVFICGDARQQLSAARLWAIMLLNSSELFVNQCANHEFMDTLEDVLNSQRTSPVVRENLLEVLAAVAYASAWTSYESEPSFLVLWRKVKPARKPDEGVPFDPDKVMTDPLSPLPMASMSPAPGDLPANPQLLQAAWPTNVDSILYAMCMQREFDEADPAHSVQGKRFFRCSICMDEMPVGSIARMVPCGHTFCRGCLHGHVTARLDERRFPILCPTCTATKGKGKGKVGEVSQSLALNLGLTDEQFTIWTEMEMVSFSVLVHCQKCQHSMFVARDDYEEVKVIVCPLPKCNHAWCKQCQHSIDFGGPKHTCDGTSELNHLMGQKGWKYCPTCKTPIQKIAGCNHIMCVAPGCNTHFCYLCGAIIKLGFAQPYEIQEAKSSHYSKGCKLS